jgi:hypothetical protein
MSAEYYKTESSFRGSLQPAFQPMKCHFFIFLNRFLVFRNPDPDPLTQLTLDPIRIRKEIHNTVFLSFVSDQEKIRSQNDLLTVGRPR